MIASWSAPKEPVRHKIPLDAELYKLHSGRPSGLDPKCSHDWFGANGHWHCVKCKGTMTFEPWSSK